MVVSISFIYPTVCHGTKWYLPRYRCIPSYRHWQSDWRHKPFTVKTRPGLRGVMISCLYLRLLPTLIFCSFAPLPTFWNVYNLSHFFSIVLKGIMYDLWALCVTCHTSITDWRVQAITFVKMGVKSLYFRSNGHSYSNAGLMTNSEYEFVSCQYLSETLINSSWANPYCFLHNWPHFWCETDYNFCSCSRLSQLSF